MLTLSEHGRATFAVVMAWQGGAVARNALSLLAEELGAPGAGGNRLVIAPPDPALGTDDQAFALETAAGPDGWTLTLTGSGERGVLYGICELLDRAERDGEAIRLAPVSLRSAPDIARRGVERHWGPPLDTPEGAEANIRLIRLLARRRVNALLWSDNWISPGWYRFLTLRHFPALYRPERAARVAEAVACLNRVIDAAHAWGMAFYLAGTEFNFPEELYDAAPELFARNAQGFRVLRLEEPGTWAFFRAKVREIMEVCPGLAGIELWSAEALDLWRCRFPDGDTRTLADWQLELFTQALGAMDAAGRPDARLICAMFIHHPDGERALLPLADRLPARCEARMKMQVEDFYRFNAPTPLAGRLTPGRDWIEFDTGGEHRGDWAGWITAGLNFLPERMRHYYDRGVRSFICRVRGFSTGPDCRQIPDADALEDVQSFKHDAYFAQCWDLRMPLEDIWRRRHRPGYPDAMLEFFRLSGEVADKAQYVGGCLTANNHATFLGSVEHYEYKMRNAEVPGNDTVRERAWILEPTDDNMALILAEKDEALAALARMQAILTACHSALPPADYATLQRALAYQTQFARVLKEHTESFFRYRLFLHAPGEGRLHDLGAALARTEAEIARLAPLDARQAQAAEALVANLRSLAWVACCAGFLAPKGVVRGALG